MAVKNLPIDLHLLGHPEIPRNRLGKSWCLIRFQCSSILIPTCLAKIHTLLMNSWFLMQILGIIQHLPAIHPAIHFLWQSSSLQLGKSRNFFTDRLFRSGGSGEFGADPRASLYTSTPRVPWLWRLTEEEDSFWVFQNGVPSGKHTKSYWKWPFIVDFPIKHGDFP